MNAYRFINKSDGRFEEATDLDSKTLKQIGDTCENGSFNILENILKSLQPDQLGRYINAMLRVDDGCSSTYYTPLMIASMHGQDLIVRLLLENYSDYCIADAQNYSSEYDIDCDEYFEHFYKQTALWLAVKCKHLNVVETLISRSQVNINHKAEDQFDSNRTPLYLACDNGQVEMVQYLIENGADLYHIDNFDSTALMIAIQCKQDDIVKYLLNLNDSKNHLLNAVNRNGTTGLHYAAYMGQLNIVKLLLEEHHANIVRCDNERTPLTAAGINNHEEVIKYLIENEKQSWFTLSEVIDELELIGSYQLHKHNFLTENFERAFHYLLWAMQLRYKNPEAPILKANLLSPIQAYGYYTECQTIEELQLIKENEDETRLVLEYLMIRERRGITSDFLQFLHDQAKLLGCNPYSRNPSTPGTRKQCEYAFRLWLHAYHLRIQTQIDLYTCLFHLKECARLMDTLIERKRTKEIRFDMVMEMFQAAENEYIRYKNQPSTPDPNLDKNDLSDFTVQINRLGKKVPTNADKCLYIILNLLFIAMKVITCSKKKKQKRRKVFLQRVRQLIKLDYRTSYEKKTLLHLSSLRSQNQYSIDLSRHFPSSAVVELLLSCGASINAIDTYHYTPLHDFASNSMKYFSIEGLSEMKRIFNLLVNAGAHLDAIAEGKTPEDCAKVEKLKNLFQKLPIQLNLKCICARMIRKNELNYNDSIPKSLQTFVELH